MIRLEFKTIASILAWSLFLALLGTPVRAEGGVAINQTSSANVSNEIKIEVDTGGNRIYGVGKEASIVTGSTTSNISVENMLNFNQAVVNYSSNNWWSKRNDSGGSDFDRNKKSDAKPEEKKFHDLNKGGYDWNSQDRGQKDKDKNEYKHDEKEEYKNGLAKKEYQSNNLRKKKELSVHLLGKHEVPGPGDMDGHGKAVVQTYKDSDRICVRMNVAKIELPATGAHIHHAKKGVAGGVVVALPSPDGNGHAEGCVSLDPQKINDIVHNPDHYYVNVHNNQYPDGAIRGQLM